MRFAGRRWAGLVLAGVLAVLIHVNLDLGCFVVSSGAPSRFLGKQTRPLGSADGRPPAGSEERSLHVGLGLAASAGLAAALAARCLTRVKGWGSGGQGGRGRSQREQMKEVKGHREAAQFFTYQKRVARIGLPPRDERYWQREEMTIFQNLRVTAGINFDLYDNIKVDRRGGRGDEEVCESFKQCCRKFDIRRELVMNIDRCGYNVPTPVQKHAMPAALLGTDVMVAAQTGSGKTAAFLVPLIQGALRQGLRKLREGPIEPSCVILAPTRELCQQICMEARRLCFRTELRICSIYGGADTMPQLKQLAEGCEIIIATPGRLEDFLQRGVLTMSEVRHLVLDEADRMLDMGFEPQIRNIIEEHGMPDSGPEDEDRQTIMFSATFPREIQDLALDFLDPTYLWIGVGRVGTAANTVDQRFADVSTTNADGKFDTLLEAIRDVPGEGGGLSKCLIFANSKIVVDDITWRLADNRIRATQIHGGLTQSARDRAINDFRQGRVAVLVATDVAARGLDLPGIDHVINYELPVNSEDYVHRIGRTGRIGNKGTATSFVSGWEPALKDIVRQIQHLMTKSQADGSESATQGVPRWVVDQARRSSGSVNRYALGATGFRMAGTGVPQKKIDYEAGAGGRSQGQSFGGMRRDRVPVQPWAEGLPARGSSRGSPRRGRY